MARDDGGIIFFAAECASGLHLHDANFVLRQSAQRHQRLMNVIRALQRTPDRDALHRIEGGDDAVILDIKLFLRSGGVFAFDDVVGFRPDAFDIALCDQKCLERVVGSPNQLRAALALFHGENRGERVVFDRDGVDRFAQKMRIGVRQ